MSPQILTVYTYPEGEGSPKEIIPFNRTQYKIPYFIRNRFSRLKANGVAIAVSAAYISSFWSSNLP
jgi:hypothetical protein